MVWRWKVGSQVSYMSTPIRINIIILDGHSAAFLQLTPTAFKD